MLLFCTSSPHGLVLRRIVVVIKDVFQTSPGGPCRDTETDPLRSNERKAE